jgi:hypothetical protein
VVIAVSPFLAPWQISVVCSQPALPNLFVQWTDLHQVERLVDGGTSIIYTANFNDQNVIVKVGILLEVSW